MDVRRPRRRLLKPRPVSWTGSEDLASSSPAPAADVYDLRTERPAPARVQLPAPGSGQAAVMLPSDDPEPAPEASLSEDELFDLYLLPPPPSGLTLVPSLAPRPEDEVLEALEANAEDVSAAISWMDDVDAVEVDRAVPDGSPESQREHDTFAMEWEPGESPSSLGVRLFHRLPPVRGLSLRESILLAALLAISPIVLGGGALLGASFGHAVRDDHATAVVVVSEPEPPEVPPPPAQEIAPAGPAAQVPVPVPIEEADSVPELRPPPKPKKAASAPAAPLGPDPWAQAPAAVPEAAVAAPVPSPPPPPEGGDDDDRRKGKKKKPR